MENKLHKAIVNATQKEVQVYKTNDGKWIDYSDCTTEYQESDLTFI